LPNATELKKTNVLKHRLEEVSAKVRTGPPLDDEEDYALAVWAGEVPLELKASDPVADPRLTAGVDVSRSALRYSKNNGR
ncbi:MAG: pyridoxamine 5'-phosphate oxidase family protein, partial [Acidobacteriota bacterium]